MENYFLSNSEEKLLSSLIPSIEEKMGTLKQQIHDKFINGIYENIYILQPWKIQKIVNEECQEFIAFLKTTNQNICIAKGKKAAIDGLHINK